MTTNPSRTYRFVLYHCLRRLHKRLVQDQKTAGQHIASCSKCLVSVFSYNMFYCTNISLFLKTRIMFWLLSLCFYSFQKPPATAPSISRIYSDNWHRDIHSTFHVTTATPKSAFEIFWGLRVIKMVFSATVPLLAGPAGNLAHVATGLDRVESCQDGR